MNMVSVPTVMATPKTCVPPMTLLPPCQSAYAVAKEPSDTTMGRKRFDSVAARMDAERMEAETVSNSLMFSSSRTRVFVVFAPLMPSLKPAVIWLLFLRT